MNYYNEFDPKTAAWLRELIKEKLIPNGKVDERSIRDVRPEDLAGFKQCHFFAGIGGWSLALKLAGWPEDKEAWSGSCPCQPWSIGNVWQGGGQGYNDPRHLWPTWFELIRERKPGAVFGEQVAAAIKKGWLDTVQGDFEREGYAFAPLVLPAVCFHARHFRQRLFFVADASSERWKGRKPVECLPESAKAPLSIHGDTIARSGRALAGDWNALFACDGLSVQLVRDALKGFGNAIVPQVAAEFIKAYQQIT